MKTNKDNFKSICKNIFEEEINKIIISNLIRKTFKYKKIVIEKKHTNYLMTLYTEKQQFNKIINKLQMIEEILNYIDEFKQYNFIGFENEYMIKISNKNKIILKKIKVNKKNSINISQEFNKVKNYMLKEDTIIEPLIDMGIFTKEGKIVSSMHDKYRQINRFIEVIEDYLKKEQYRKINIIDFGCGKSYLTFLIYYYLKYIKKIDVNIVGLDLNEEVIIKCNETAKKYGYENLSFEVGDINGYDVKFNVDMVIVLHACDMATDYALFNAIKWNAKFIFSVPCCQHEINSQLKSKNFEIINRYGIAKERISAIYTDIIRCNLLESMSYKVQLLEYIDFDATPKNLLIRAKLSTIPKNIKINRIDEVENLLREINASQKLYQLLYDDNRLERK